MTTCNICRRSGYSGPCVPAGEPIPPLFTYQYEGTYANSVYSDGGGVTLSVAAKNNVTLAVDLGPLSADMYFDETCMSLLDVQCADLAVFMMQQGVLPEYSTAASTMQGEKKACSLAEFRGSPPEIPAAGVSTRNRTTAFPWGANVPLPDGPSMYAVSEGYDDDSVLFFIFNGVAFMPMTNITESDAITISV